jgi:membrane protein implicated in regulation of membrane protease activity
MPTLIDPIMPLAANPTAGSAVVAAVHDDGTVDIVVGGANAPAACLEGYTDRAEGDVVFVVPVRGGYVVVNRFTTT